MPTYANNGGDSSVASYEIGFGSITVTFTDGSTYTYTNASAGAHHVAEMQRLAEAGAGLNSYIDNYVRLGYASKS